VSTRNRRTYEVDSGLVISENGVWLPGVYADRLAARAAFALTAEELQELNDRVCSEVTGEGRAATFVDVLNTIRGELGAGQVEAGE
jgi:hypothetical protein